MAEQQSNKSLRCVVVTPEAPVLDAEADFVAFPAYDGEVGVLPHRLPLVARLGYGLLRVVRGGKTERLFVSGGFAEVKDNTVTLLTTSAVKPENVKLADLENKLAQVRGEAANSIEAGADKAVRIAGLQHQIRLAGTNAV